jgi:uroporphyrinogen-III synthase
LADLTSANAVRALPSGRRSLGIALAQPARLKVAAVGEATAAAARKAGLHVGLCRKPTWPRAWLRAAEGIHLQTIGKRVLLARAAVARDVIPDALREAGAEVDVVDAYRNVLPEAAPEMLRRLLRKESMR